MVKKRTNGPAWRRRLHVAAEATALVTVLPLSVYAAAHRSLPSWARVAFGAAAAGTAIVDGLLLHSYITQRRARRRELADPVGTTVRQLVSELDGATKLDD